MVRVFGEVRWGGGLLWSFIARLSKLALLGRQLRGVKALLIKEVGAHLAAREEAALGMQRGRGGHVGEAWGMGWGVWTHSAERGR